MEFRIVQILLLEGSEVSVVDSRRHCRNRVPGKSVSHRIVFTRNMTKSAVVFSYCREVSLLSR